AGVIRFGFLVLAVHVGDDAFEAGGVLAFAAETVLVLHDDLVVLAVQNGFTRRRWQILPAGVHGEPQVVAQAFDQAVPVFGGGLAQRPWGDRALGQGDLGVRDDQVLV